MHFSSAVILSLTGVLCVSAAAPPKRYDDSMSISTVLQANTDSEPPVMCVFTQCERFPKGKTSGPKELFDQGTEICCRRERSGNGHETPGNSNIILGNDSLDLTEVAHTACYLNDNTKAPIPRARFDACCKRVGAVAKCVPK